MAEGHPVYGWMRVGQYGRFQRGFYHHWNQEIFAAVIDYFAINPRTKAGHLSHGQRAGLHLAMTLAIEPEVLMLDDPATGLDPAARRSLLEAMIYFTRSRERTIFFSTHLLDDVERVADHVAVLDYSILRACAASTRSATACARWSCGSRRAASQAAGHPRPAAGDADRERAVSHRGQSQRTDRARSRIPRGRSRGRAADQPGRRLDRPCRTAG